MIWCSFVTERLVLSEALIVNEAIGDYMACKKEGVMVRIELENVYDHVDWVFF